MLPFSTPSTLTPSIQSGWATDHFLRHQYKYAAALLSVLFIAVCSTRLTTQFVDVQRLGLPLRSTELVIWEVSSVLVVFLLVPAIIALNRYERFSVDRWARPLAVHLCGSMAFCLIHVLAIYVTRKVAYHIASYPSYEFDSWAGQIGYEYLKDVKTYFILLSIIYTYQLFTQRLELALTSNRTPPTHDSAKTENHTHDKFAEYFSSTKLGSKYFLSSDKIERIEAQGNYVNLISEVRSYPLRTTMKQVEQQLDPSIFIRVHRSSIVNKTHIRSLTKLSSGDSTLTLKDGSVIKCSRTYAHKLKGIHSVNS